MSLSHLGSHCICHKHQLHLCRALQKHHALLLSSCFGPLCIFKSGPPAFAEAHHHLMKNCTTSTTTSAASVAKKAQNQVRLPLWRARSFLRLMVCCCKACGFQKRRLATRAESAYTSCSTVSSLSLTITRGGISLTTSLDHNTGCICRGGIQ
jgi:hypothetical protein